MLKQTKSLETFLSKFKLSEIQHTSNNSKNQINCKKVCSVPKIHQHSKSKFSSTKNVNTTTSYKNGGPCQKILSQCHCALHIEGKCVQQDDFKCIEIHPKVLEQGQQNIRKSAKNHCSNKNYVIEENSKHYMGCPLESITKDEHKFGDILEIPEGNIGTTPKPICRRVVYDEVLICRLLTGGKGNKEDVRYIKVNSPVEQSKSPTKEEKLHIKDSPVEQRDSLLKVKKDNFFESPIKNSKSSIEAEKHQNSESSIEHLKSPIKAEKHKKLESLIVQSKSPKKGKKHIFSESPIKQPKSPKIVKKQHIVRSRVEQQISETKDEKDHIIETPVEKQKSPVKVKKHQIIESPIEKPKSPLKGRNRPIAESPVEQRKSPLKAKKHNVIELPIEQPKSQSKAKNLYIAKSPIERPKSPSKAKRNNNTESPTVQRKSPLNAEKDYITESPIAQPKSQQKDEKHHIIDSPVEKRKSPLKAKKHQIFEKSINYTDGNSPKLTHRVDSKGDYGVAQGKHKERLNLLQLADKLHKLDDIFQKVLKSKETKIHHRNDNPRATNERDKGQIKKNQIGKRSIGLNHNLIRLCPKPANYETIDDDIGPGNTHGRIHLDNQEIGETGSKFKTFGGTSEFIVLSEDDETVIVHVPPKRDKHGQRMNTTLQICGDQICEIKTNDDN